MIAIVDYGVGNLFSLLSSLRGLDLEAEVTGDAGRLRAADRIILPGVGAFGDARAKLDATGLVPVIQEEAEKKPLLGICLGMQLLFEKSLEYGEYAGLGLIPGVVRPIAGHVPQNLKIPHIGWNALHLSQPTHPLLANTQDGDCVYFVHSYYADTPARYILATAEYGAPLTAAVANGNVLGCQFHPEKSGPVGLGILQAFCSLPASKGGTPC